MERGKRQLNNLELTKFQQTKKEGVTPSKNCTSADQGTIFDDSLDRTTGNALLIEDKTKDVGTNVAPCKTKRMLQIEEAVGEPIDEYLRSLYLGELKTMRQVGEELGLSLCSLKEWFEKFNIPTRTYTEASALRVRTPESEKRRIEAVRIAYKKHKDEILSKIHTEESNRRRSISLKHRFATDENALQQTRANMKAAKDVYLRSLERKRNDIFGKEAQFLYEMHIGQGLTIEEIALKTGYSAVGIFNLMRKNNIPRIPKTHKQTIHSYQLIMEALWKNPDALSRLPKKQEEVIMRRFLTDGRVPTLQEVANEMGITRQAVNLYEEKAINKIIKKDK